MSASSYILCATPRSGSTLLCDLLAATGVAGRPNSFYRRQSMAHFADEFGVDGTVLHGPVFDRAYLDAILRHSTGETGTFGTFGMRLMWESAVELEKRLAPLFPDRDSGAARFAAAFGPPVYLHLSRTDKVAQAISRLKAEQSGLWHRAADGSVREGSGHPRQPVYDFAALQDFIAEAENDDAAWRNWFAEHGITPHAILYEDLSANPAAVLADVLSALGRDPAIAAAIAPQTSRLADGVSRNWAERFAFDAAKN